MSFEQLGIFTSEIIKNNISNLETCVLKTIKRLQCKLKDLNNEVQVCHDDLETHKTVNKYLESNSVSRLEQEKKDLESLLEKNKSRIQELEVLVDQKSLDSKEDKLHNEKLARKCKQLKQRLEARDYKILQNEKQISVLKGLLLNSCAVTAGQLSGVMKKSITYNKP